MNALLLLLIAALLALFNVEASGTDPGIPQENDEPEEVEEPDDDENGDNGENGDIFIFNIDDQLTLDLIYTNQTEGMASFPQDLVTLDMSYDDVIAAYGEPENEVNILNYTVHQYGDIGVAYFEEDDMVADVLYMPSITYDELIAVLGEADQEVLGFEEGAQDDTPYANYLIAENDEGNLYASFKLFADDNGVMNVWFMDKLLLDDEMDEITEEEVNEISSTLNGYYASLGAYYRGESEEIFNYIYGEDNALNQLIVANNESDDFVNYDVLSWTILDIVRADDNDNAYEVLVEREYTFGDESQFEEVTLTLDQTENGIVVESIN